MGAILNPEVSDFHKIAGPRYVDKTELIAYTNSVMETDLKLICFSRPRRFGKSYAAKMLAAFYSKGADWRAAFEKLNIAQNDRFSKCQSFKSALLEPIPWDRYLNQCNVLFLDLSRYSSLRGNKDFLSSLQGEVAEELKKTYSDVLSGEETTDLSDLLVKINQATKNRFYIIIDEWDVPFREFSDQPDLLLSYVDFLRKLFKTNLSDTYLYGAYMTGILPIKKYPTQSALSNFSEFSMLEPGLLAEFVGFTEEEVRLMCDKADMSFAEMQRWYDGYRFDRIGHIYNPNSVMVAINKRRCDSYWSKSSSWESLSLYIDLNFDGLRDAVLSLLGGTPCRIDPTSFLNDMTSMHSKDDVLTLLVHLGYVAYDIDTSTVSIPNEEVRREFLTALKNGKRTELTNIIALSDKLLVATIGKHADRVAELLEEVHLSHTSPHHYDNEEALRSVVIMGYLSCVDHYQRFEEISGGRGYIDILFHPNPGSGYPALLIELKKNHPADTAIAQIRERKYPEALKQFNYHGELLLIGISYNDKNNHHDCRIESLTL